MAKQLIGKITHYFPKVGVAVVELKKGMKKGDMIEIEGHGRSFQQEVKSMQIDKEDIEKAKAGDDIGLKVDEEVKENDQVYKV